MQAHIHSRVRGFTLIELLVVIAIVVVLAAAGAAVMLKFSDHGNKVQAMAQFKDLAAGFEAFEADNGRQLLLPPKQKHAGQDTVYGAPKGEFSNRIVVAVLGGTSSSLGYKVSDLEKGSAGFSIKDINREGGVYLNFKATESKKNGVGPDGVLYDPWGRPLMIAVNGFKAPDSEIDIQDYNAVHPGMNDKALDTMGLAEYEDVKPPLEKAWVAWTYGKDGKKGVAGDKKGKLPEYKDSGDVVSWQ